MFFHHQSMLENITLGITERMMWRENRQVFIVGSVSNLSDESRVSVAAHASRLPLRSTGDRTDFLFPISSSRYINTTHNAMVRRCRPPAASLFAAIRAYSLRSSVLSFVYRAELLTTDFAFKDGILSSHGSQYTISREVWRDEIAAKRLSQEVFDFDEVSRG